MNADDFYADLDWVGTHEDLNERETAMDTDDFDPIPMGIANELRRQGFTDLAIAMATPNEVRASLAPKYGMSRMSRADVIQQQMRRLERELAELARFGDDVYDTGDVIKIERIFDRHISTGTVKYSYAAIKIPGQKWCVTGPKSPQYVGWDELVSWLNGDGTVVTFVPMQEIETTEVSEVTNDEESSNE